MILNSVIKIIQTESALKQLNINAERIQTEKGLCSYNFLHGKLNREIIKHALAQRLHPFNILTTNHFLKIRHH